MVNVLAILAWSWGRENGAATGRGRGVIDGLKLRLWWLVGYGHWDRHGRLRMSVRRRGDVHRRIHSLINGLILDINRLSLLLLLLLLGLLVVRRCSDCALNWIRHRSRALTTHTTEMEYTR